MDDRTHSCIYSYVHTRIYSGINSSRLKSSAASIAIYVVDAEEEVRRESDRVSPCDDDKDDNDANYS